MYVIVRRQYHDIQSIDLKVDRVWINLKPVQTMVRNLDPKVKCGYNTIGGGGGVEENTYWGTNASDQDE